MSYLPAAILVALAVVLAIPGIVLGAAVLRAGRVPRVLRGGEPSIQTFLLFTVLALVSLAAVFLVPWAVAFGGLAHGFTAVAGLFLAVLTLLGLGYAWRRGVLRWQ